MVNLFISWGIYLYFVVIFCTLYNTLKFFKRKRFEEFYLYCIIYAIFWPVYWIATMYGIYKGKQDAKKIIQKWERDHNENI